MFVKVKSGTSPSVEIARVTDVEIEHLGVKYVLTGDGTKDGSLHLVATAVSGVQPVLHIQTIASNEILVGGYR